MVDSEINQNSELVISSNDLAVKTIDKILRPLDKTDGILRIYRGLYGKGSVIDGEYYNSGFEDEQLKDVGLFLNNLSFAQNQSRYISTGVDRRVIGLPVSLTTREGLMWIEGKRYKNHPAISVLDIPLSFLFGSGMRLMRNGLEPRFDYQLTKEQTISHISGKETISGECYLTHIPTDIKQFERIIVPNQLNSDGKINFESGFRILD